MSIKNKVAKFCKQRAKQQSRDQPLQAAGKVAKQTSAFASSRQRSKVKISHCKQQTKEQSKDQPLQAADKDAK